MKIVTRSCSSILLWRSWDLLNFRRIRRRVSLRGRFLSLGSAFLVLSIGFGVGDILKLLSSSGKNLGREHAIPLVDGDGYQSLKLAGQQSVSTDGDQQLPFFVEDLNAILHAVGDPDVSVAINGDAFRPGEIARAVAVLAEGADKLIRPRQKSRCDCSLCRRRTDCLPHPPRRQQAWKNRQEWLVHGCGLSCQSCAAT